MPKSVVADFQGCSFKGIDLSRFITDWKDTRQFALSIHRYWKRDGGDVEVLGRKPHQAKVTLAYAGTTWRKDWLPFAASLDADPSGPLVHPVYGQMPAVCEGFADATMNIEFASNIYIVPLTFIEDQVDAALSSQSRDPSTLNQQAQQHGAALLQRAPQQGPIYNSILQYVTTALGYVEAAVATVEQALSYGRTLDAQLERVQTSALAARGAVRADPATGSDSERYAMLALVEQLFDDCVQLSLAVGAATAPVLITYVVPSTTHIATLATRFYGADGLSRIPEIMANNAGRIPNPAAIARGTELSMAPPTLAL
jgi:prophage DNA circulation protein